MNKFTEKLKSKILKGLPGTEVQWQMASSDRMINNFPTSAGKDAMMLHELLTIISSFLPG